MARPLRDPPPSSSIARLLDAEAAARATSRQEGLSLSQVASAGHVDHAQSHPAHADWPDAFQPRRVKREVLLCPETDETLDEVVRILRLNTRSRVTTSHVVRALLRATHRRLEVIRSQASQLGPRRLPSNAPGAEQTRRNFEEALAAIFLADSTTR